ncbi:MAG: hypothetical protein LBH28_02090 [Oscillospiraceae bacterium]|nr:hypothetical protein [Oscillospiraceae bacterium]
MNTNGNILGVFGSEDIEGVLALIDRLEQSSFDYLKLEGGGMSVVIGKNGAGEASGEVRVIQTAAQSGNAAAPAAAAEQTADALALKEEAASASASMPAVAGQEGVVVVRAPSQGLFYAQSEPGAPPYVSIGASVKEGDTVGLVEIMKTFTAITSPADGKVVGIHVKNEEILEPGQPLISIQAEN